MNIIWYGQSCFKIQSKDIVLITDPFDKKIGLRPPFGSADIVTISHDHYDHNNFQVIKNDPFVIDSAGEYEIKKVTIKGDEDDTALLGNAGVSFKLFGKPKVPVDQVIGWTAKWIEGNNKLLGKPTHFEIRDGKY